MKFTKKLFGSPFVSQHIAEITGKHFHHRPYAWIRGDESYSHITGGIAMPTFDQPGYVLAVGVIHDTPVHINCLAELSSDDEYELIDRAQEIQAEYGQGVIENWWGDPASMMSILNERNIEDPINPVYVADPVDSDKPDSFQIYMSRLRISLRERNKTFFLNDCNSLRNDIIAFVRDKKAKPDIHPALNIAGALIHTILMTTPWEQAIESTSLIPTSPADQAAYEVEQEEKMLEKELWGGAV